MEFSKLLILDTSLSESHFISCRGIIINVYNNIIAAVLAGFGAYGDDASRKFVKVRNLIQRYQYTVTSIEKCAKPVIAAIHGGCIGAGNSLIASCDIR